MMKLKKWTAALAALAVMLSCAAPAFASKASTPAVENTPTLSIGYNGRTQNASRNTFRWNNGLDSVSAVGQSVLAAGRELPVFTRVKGIDTIGLSFSYKPKSAVVNRWKSTERGKLTALPVTEALVGGTINLPADTEAYLYDVVAQWDEGEAHFAFEISSREADSLSVSPPPANYTRALAVAHADFVMDGEQCENLGRLDDFVAKLAAKMPAKLRVVVFEDEKAAWLYDLYYNGERVRCVADNTRDTNDGAVTAADYETLSVEEQIDSTGAYEQTTVALRIQNSKRTLGGFVKPPVTMRAEPSSMLEGNVRVGMEISNSGSATLGYDMAYTLDRLTESGWKALSVTGTTAKVEGLLQTDEKVIEPLALSRVKTQLTPGVYRVGKELTYDGEARMAYAEFEVLEPRVPLELGNPQSIQISIGSGKAATNATLLRQGKHEGRSPLVFAMTELARFQPLDRDTRLVVGAQNSGATLTLAYADGKTVKLYLNPNAQLVSATWQKPTVSLSYGGRDYAANRDVYERLQGCAVAVSEAAKGK